MNKNEKSVFRDLIRFSCLFIGWLDLRKCMQIKWKLQHKCALMRKAIWIDIVFLRDVRVLFADLIMNEKKHSIKL